MNTSENSHERPGLTPEQEQSVLAHYRRMAALYRELVKDMKPCKPGQHKRLKEVHPF